MLEFKVSYFAFTRVKLGQPFFSKIDKLLQLLISALHTCRHLAFERTRWLCHVFLQLT